MKFNPISRWRRFVRSRSIIRSSYRRDTRDLDYWLRWQLAKGVVVIVLLVIPDMLGWFRTPSYIYVPILVAFAAYACLLHWDTWQATRRMDKRRIEKLESLGCQLPTLKTALTSADLWKLSLNGKTMHEILKDKSLAGEFTKLTSNGD